MGTGVGGTGVGGTGVGTGVGGAGVGYAVRKDVALEQAEGRSMHAILDVVTIAARLVHGVGCADTTKGVAAGVGVSVGAGHGGKVIACGDG